MTDQTEAETHVVATETLTLLIAPLLCGHDERVQSAVLADLLACWLAGHFAGSTGATEKLREILLQQHIALVRKLIEPNEKMILEHMRREAQ